MQPVDEAKAHPAEETNEAKAAQTDCNRSESCLDGHGL